MDYIFHPEKYLGFENFSKTFFSEMIFFRRECINPKYVLMPRDAAMDILPIVVGGLSSRLGMLFNIYAFTVATLSRTKIHRPDISYVPLRQ